MTDFTRRKMLGIAAGTLASAATSAGLTHPAEADDAGDLDLFVKLSSALTGIPEAKLAPKRDPIQIKRAYFDEARSDPGFAGLMQIVRDYQSSPAAAADRVVNSNDANISFLGRSIILAWYLGAWYPPKVLMQTPQPSSPISPLKVISAAAYTQSWALRVAQAHPMGYSEFRFGYWSDEPLPLDFI
jgi:hypothetical protein